MQNTNSTCIIFHVILYTQTNKSAQQTDEGAQTFMVKLLSLVHGQLETTTFSNVKCLRNSILKIQF